MSRTIHTPLAARLWALVAALLVAFGAALATASPAQAHDELIGSDPAADSSLDALPAQLTLTFSAEIADDEGASVVQVTDAAGTALADGSPVIRDNVLTQPLAGEASGAVTVLWKVVSSDGHPISGEFSFSVPDAPAPTPSETPSESAAPEPAETTPAVTDAPDMTEDPVATAFASPLTWVGIAAVAIAVIALIWAARRRRGDAPRPGSGPPADH